MAYTNHYLPQGHTCGCYTVEQLPTWPSFKRVYLPQIRMSSHVTLREHTFDTYLTQTFINSTVNSLKRIRYSFPLYDGVSVVEFTCETGSRIIKGVVKRCDIARATFEKAVERGETAGLLEQLPESADIFTTTVGNIEPQAQVKITIKYIGELKHDAGVDGLRLTIPTAIAPRYGEYPGEIMDYMGTRGGMQVTVDAEMTSAISKIQSPTHPISTSIGTISTDPNAEPILTRASATLAQATTELERDIVIQVVSKGIGIPRAILETHPSIPGHRAISATLVPNFALHPAKCEIIFVADRSGSMSDKIGTLRSALKVALKSLPLGTYFNICSFGSSYSFLWPQSKLYSPETLDKAMGHVSVFAADYGGTEMFAALQAATKKHRKGSNTEIVLLTDGEIYAQDEIISFIKKQMDGKLRLFTLGIGDLVSSSLLEGIARAGNGCSQSVSNDEQLDVKMMRLVKSALSSHIEDFSIELKCRTATGSETAIIEKASTTVFVEAKDKKDSDGSSKAPIPLFSPDNIGSEFAVTTETKDVNMEGEDRYAHLPKVSYPAILQAPHSIPPLFPQNRTTVYLLMSPNTAHMMPTAITLRGKSSQGPLEMEIPIDMIDQPSTTVHQLAAKKAIQELEDGYGWLAGATDQKQNLIVDSYGDVIDEIVEREAVRLGVTFQVSSKACSFVAVETDEGEEVEDAKDAEDMEYEFVDAAAVPYDEFQQAFPASAGVSSRKRRVLGLSLQTQTSTQPDPGSSAARPYCPFGGAKRCRKQTSTPSPPISNRSTYNGRVVHGLCVGPAPAASIAYDAMYDPVSPTDEDAGTLLDRIVATQKFQGSWPAEALSWKELENPSDVLRALNDLGENASTDSSAKEALATAVVVLYLERKMAEQKEIWELLVEKARAWLVATFDENAVKILFQGAGALVGNE